MTCLTVICPVCGLLVKAYTPKQGDGSHVRPFHHKREQMKGCQWLSVNCEGRFELVDVADTIEDDR